jgi:transposase-like protein
LLSELEGMRQSNSEDQVLKTIREINEANGYHCPDCGSTFYSVHSRSGKYMRLACKACGRTYSEHTGTVLEKLQKPHLWPRFIELTLEGRSLRYISAELKISLPTAFTWRHKLLSSLKTEDGAKLLSGIVEVDEKEFDINEKGSRKLERKPYKRPTDRKNRQDKGNKVTAIVTVERKSRKSSMKVVKKGRLDKMTLDKELLGHINKESIILCTDAHPTYYGWTEKHDIPHYWIIASKGEHTWQGIYHVQNINSHNSRFEKWFGRFNGVASKYLNNYLNYFNLMEKIKKHNDRFQRTLFETLGNFNARMNYHNIEKNYQLIINPHGI